MTSTQSEALLGTCHSYKIMQWRENTHNPSKEVACNSHWESDPHAGCPYFCIMADGDWVSGEGCVAWGHW